MAPQKANSIPVAIVALAGCVATLALAVLWHACGWAAAPQTSSYPFTNFFTGCIGWLFVAAYFAAAVALGAFLRPLWSIALGMILPLPCAMIVEMMEDPTSHNLFPFEIVLYWLPAFLIALAGAKVGKILAARQMGKDNGF